MGKMPGSKSIFSQELDRAIFVTYFLGAVVPLLTFGYAVQQYVLPALDGDKALTITAIGVTIGVTILSLTAFLALRILTLNAVTRMNEDNARLESILSASQGLSSSLHGQAVAETAVACARQLADATGALLVVRSTSEKPLEPCAATDEEAQTLYLDHAPALLEIVEEAMSTRDAAVLSAHDRKPRDVGATAPSAAIAVPLHGKGSADGALVLVDTQPNREFEPEVRDALSTLAALTSVSLQNANLQDAQRNFFAHTTDMLVMALDSHVDNRKGHPNAVAQLSNRLARVLELSPEKMQDLHFAALLHDIGMLKISTAHHRSPGHFQRHPVLGFRMLSRIRLWEEVAPIVLHHHEWFDGAGYPEGLAGDAIPIESRIIAVADSFDAMTRADAHRMALSPEEALSEIRKGAGTQFDPDVVVALAKLAERGELESGSR